MRIGIFGGTFDPPHHGHLILAAEALDQLRLDKILWTLTGDPPHKPDAPITPLPGRLAMLQAALEGNQAFELSRVEIDRPGPHYAVDTVKILRREYPRAELIYLIGADSLRDLPTWHTPQAFVTRLDGLGVMGRPGVEPDLPALEKQIPELADKFVFISAPLIEISSSLIRARVAAGKPYRYFVPPAVYRMIEENQFYRLMAYSQVEEDE
jgi:nicotinate-nucleotide adenylyltransferase